MGQNIKTGRILAFRNDRLGARIICVVNAMRLAARHDLPFAVHWHAATDIGRVFNDPLDFFAPDLVTDHFISREEFESARTSAIRFDAVKADGIMGLRETLASGKNVMVDMPFGFAVLDGEDPGTVAADCARIWRSFPFAPALTPFLQDISDKVAGSTAYHLRRGDITSFPRAMNRAWPDKYIPDDYYMLHMERVLAEGIKPVLYSDAAKAISRFKAAYPALIPAETLFDGADVGEGQRDLLELYAMSCSARIIAPGNSAFSSTAAALGGSVKIDVIEDISPEERAAARARLAARLAAHGKVDIVADAGDLGQSIQHLVMDQSAEGLYAEAAQTVSAYVEGGLDISFVYPLLTELQLKAGDPDGAIRTGAIMLTRPVYHRKDFANGEALHAIAHLGKGNLKAAAKHAANAFWHEPETPYVRELVGVMVRLGLLNGANFLPPSPLMLLMRSRTLPQVERNPAFGVLKTLAERGMTQPLRAPGIEMLIWDWFLLLRSYSKTYVAKHPNHSGFEKAFAKLRNVAPSPELRSIELLYHMHIEPTEDGLTALDALARAHPDDAMIQHRVSAAAWLVRDFETSRTAAEAAAEIAGPQPAHIAWRGLVRAKCKDFDKAATDIEAAIRAGLHLPSLYTELAGLQTRLGQPAEAIMTLNNAVALAPREQDVRFARASALIELDEPGLALEDLEVLASLDTTAPKVVLLHAKCLVALGQPEDAVIVLDQALLSNVGNARLQSARNAIRTAPSTA